MNIWGTVLRRSAPASRRGAPGTASTSISSTRALAAEELRARAQ